MLRWNVVIIEIHREANQHACDVTGGKSRSYGGFNSMVKGSQFEYDSSHWRHNIHVAPLADSRTFSAANE